MEDLKEKCGHRHPTKGVCDRVKGHPGPHCDKGENIPGGLDGVQGKKYQTWLQERSD